MKKIIYSLALTLMSPCILAYNGLGNTVSTPTTSKIASVKIKTTSVNNYSVITTEEEGVTVDEYINSQNIVFAVTWKGQFLPDFASLLGQYATASVGSQANVKIEHRQFHQEKDNLVVNKSYHGRLKTGLAYLKDELPANFSINDLNK